VTYLDCFEFELHRVGCNIGAIDGNWNMAAQRSLALFNKECGYQARRKVASLDALDAVRTQVCPHLSLICDRGYKTDGNICSKIHAKRV